jgi:phosphatidylserine/phosphatidylglycerophosphate/cardiolipin synthase-like enzyme
MMSRLWGWVVRWGLIAWLAVPTGCAAGDRPTATPARVAAAFDGDCRSLLLNGIDAASNEIVIAIYSLTDEGIVNALIGATRRDVAVKLKYDAKQADFEPMKKALSRLRHNRIRCTAINMGDDEHAVMHHKFAVVDRGVVFTGSFNFTVLAWKSNRENLVRIESPEVAEAFRRTYETIRSR